jgi:uncharacterized membrane protein SpoIIM required for sporulation
VILDLDRFLVSEEPFWTELSALLDRAESSGAETLTLEEARRLHYLHERTAADLVKLGTFCAKPEAREYVESLLARSYAEVHSESSSAKGFSFWRWLKIDFPSVFRARFRAFLLALAACLLGTVFGGAVILLDPATKPVLLPFSHLMGSPAERVAAEERNRGSDLPGHHATFSSTLMTHNTQVSLMALALGMTFGIGTLIFMFYNGVILGAVVVDYVHAGQGVFVTGWLLPHGSFEIPAMLIAGQAGLVLGGALLGWGGGESLVTRFRKVLPDVVTLAGGFGLMLIWAGIIESFFSQYHEPILPYAVKITFGVLELGFLIWYLSPRRRETNPIPKGNSRDA